MTQNFMETASVTPSVGRGTSSPLGATVQPEGINFSVYSKNATLVELLLFDSEDAAKPRRSIPLSPREHRTYHYWNIFVPDLLGSGLWLQSSRAVRA